ncbi:MAG: serine/threonine protein kinase, partial [Lentisphaeria bacterium]|nr:serine/threonine protein kinase [Lentisphaeria bacterium]
MSDSKNTLPPRSRRQRSAEDTLPPQREKAAGDSSGQGAVLLGKYRVLEELGRGGMGVVCRCFDEISKTEVAIKTLAPELAASSWEMEKIRENYQIVNKLHHPHIANYNALEFDESRGEYLLVMEYVEGEELRYYLRRVKEAGDFSEKKALTLIRQAAEAIDFAHSMKVLHRDIKPANMMVDRYGRVKVLDFGLAAQIHSSLSKVSVTKLDSTAGTVSYMAPEQWRGQVPDERADQYALAATVYEIFAGVPPFENADHEILRQCVLTETPRPLRDVPEYINTAVLRALSKKPEERFESCTAFAEALSGKIDPQEDRSSETKEVYSDFADQYYDLDYALEELEKKAKALELSFDANTDYQRLARNGKKAFEFKDYARAVRYFSDALAIGEKIVAEEEARRKAEE